jgi:hypothetical protein
MKMIACCGLDCADCNARTAFITNDDSLREKTAAEWSALYGADIKSEHINCTGCREPGVKVPHCENGCFMRKCAIGKGVATCAQCTDYPCAELSSFFAYVPEARANLEALIN